jgi:TolA-binding protein
MKLSGLLVSAALLVLASPAVAQDANVEGRVGKLEKEMKAVQRKVFPDGAGKYFEPEIKPADQVKDPSKTASGTEVTDLIARVDALEAQLATLTGQVEQQGNAAKSMEARLKALENQVKALDAVEAPAVSSKPATSDTPVIAASTKAPAASAKPSATTAKPAATKPDAGRAAAVAKIEKPQTGDGFEDGYNYGYRLWESKYFPEAQVQLEATVKKYPTHKRVSFAKNLLGRAWLDDGRPSQAAKIFYDNYKSDANGERAPESLYFLGESLIKMDKLTDACDVFGQLAKAYPDEVAGRLAGRVAEGRKKAKCK